MQRRIIYLLTIGILSGYSGSPHVEAAQNPCTQGWNPEPNLGVIPDQTFGFWYDAGALNFTPNWNDGSDTAGSCCSADCSETTGTLSRRWQIRYVNSLTVIHQGTTSNVTWTPTDAGTYDLYLEKKSDAEDCQVEIDWEICTLYVIDVELMWVEYSGDIELKTDPTPSEPSEPYLDEHWEADGNDPDSDPDREYPFAYPRNTKLKISAEWKLTPPNPDGTIEVKANGTGNLDFTSWRNTAPTPQGAEIASELTDGSTPNVVDYIPGFNIVWSMRFNGGTPCDAGQNHNPLYVPLDTPEGGTETFLSVAYIGCKEAAGEDTESGVFNEIWSEFASLSVSKQGGGAAMTYFSDWEGLNTTTSGLLEDGDGQCGAWVDLLRDCLEMQGISVASPTIVKSENAGEQMVFNDWTFGSTSVSLTVGAETYEYRNLPANFSKANDMYNWACGRADVTDAGNTGQGSSTPDSIFLQHIVFERNDIYYDPSFGRTYSSLADMESQMIDGFCWMRDEAISENTTWIDCDINGDGDKADSDPDWPIYYFRKDDTLDANELL